MSRLNVRAVAGLGQHRGQLREPLDAVLDAPLRHKLSLDVDQGDVVVLSAQSIPQNTLTLLHLSIHSLDVVTRLW